MAKTSKKAITIDDLLQESNYLSTVAPYQIPENWYWMQIGSIAELFTGDSINETIKQKKYTGQTEGLIYIATKDIGFDGIIDYETNVRIPDYQSFRIAPENTPLLCIEGGSAGRKIGFTNQPVCFVNKLCAFVARGILSKYIYYYLLSQYFYDQFNNKKHGLIGGVSVKELSSITIAIPPLAEQQRIVDRIESFFVKLDEAKEKAQAVIDGYDDRRAAILHKAFAGELTEEWAKQNGISSISWETKDFEDVAEVKSHLVEPSEYPNYPHIAPDNIEKKTGVLLEYHTIAEDGVKSGKHRFYSGQILYSKIRPNLSKVVIVDFDGLCSADMYPIEPKDGVNTRFLWYQMLSDDFVLQASTAGSRSVLPKINQKELASIKIRITDLKEQKRVAEILDMLFEKEQQIKEAAEQVIDQIDSMKKSILARAFRGELGTNDPNDEPAIELLKKIL